MTSSPVISEIEIIPIKPRAGLVGFVSCLVDQWLYLGGIGLHTRPSGEIRLVFPDKTLPNGKIVNLFHPIRQKEGELLTKAIAKAYEELQSEAPTRTVPNDMKRVGKEEPWRVAD